jgi:tripartite-type tricarboxylate transporter receptor subunit TctC
MTRGPSLSVASIFRFSWALVLASALIGVVAGPWLTPVAAEEFPNRPIQLIVPYAAGGMTDQVARLASNGMAKRLGQPVLVVNRPGASTNIGTQSVARAAPDGHTIIMVSTPFVSNPSLYKEVPYAQSDFIPIMPLAMYMNILVVNPDLPIHTVADLIGYIKARPGQVNYATFGIGSSSHLATLLFESKIGQKMTAVHYRGGAPAATGVMTGEVQMEFGGTLSVGGGVQAGKLRPIAVTSPTRLNVYPDVPSLLESNIDLGKGTWFGLLAPAGTPAPIVHKLYEAAKSTMDEPEIRKAVIDTGGEVFEATPEEFAKFIADESKLWGKVLAGISIQKQ